MLLGFIPVDSTTVEARYICSSNESFRFQVVKQNTNTTMRSVDFKGIKADSVVACVYEEGGLWYLAKVFENNEITSELKVKYFIPGGERSIVTGFQTQLERNYTFLTYDNIIKIVTSLAKKTPRARKWQLNEAERNEIETLYCNMKTNY